MEILIWCVLVAGIGLGLAVSMAILVYSEAESVKRLKGKK
jgi:hypothetical protein